MVGEAVKDRTSQWQRILLTATAALSHLQSRKWERARSWAQPLTPQAKSCSICAVPKRKPSQLRPSSKLHPSPCSLATSFISLKYPSFPSLQQQMGENSLSKTKENKKKNPYLQHLGERWRISLQRIPSEQHKLDHKFDLLDDNNHILSQSSAVFF